MTAAETQIIAPAPSSGSSSGSSPAQSQLPYPLKVAYINKVTSWWGDGILTGLAVPGYATEDYNCVKLAFWSCAGEPFDIALLWKNIGDYGISGMGGNTQ